MLIIFAVRLRVVLLASPDWDDMLAYKTESKVIIRHRTIGGIYYFVMLLILVGYVGVYQYYLSGGWGVVHDLSGSLRATGMSQDLSKSGTGPPWTSVDHLCDPPGSLLPYTRFRARRGSLLPPPFPRVLSLLIPVPTTLPSLPASAPPSPIP
jgi:hypothetical protein